ncbi:MAG TPA: hypothetical protein VL022_07310 [Moheibacter sp.]|nr:hypothetical protein [Moheibacter sp.]
MFKKYALAFCFIGLGFLAQAQEIEAPQEAPQTFEYLDLKKDFDLLVDFTWVNPECSTATDHYYSLIIGTTVIGEYIERISLLVPCLENEFQKGDLLTIQPLPTPQGRIHYVLRTYQIEGEEFQEILGGEFKAVWGKVIQVF